MRRAPFHLAVGIFVCALAVTAGATQIVFLDFDSGVDDPHVYTAAQRAAIKSVCEGHYSLFDFSFTTTAPVAGDYSTIRFNTDPLGGLAEDIDHRNLNKNDSATVNAVGILDLGFAPKTEANIIALSSLIASHELGHLQGLRHADSIGPLGVGIITGGPFFSAPFAPPYPGPVDAATEVGFHLMASPGSVGQTPLEAVSPAFFSERSAIKLTFNESGTVVAEAGGNNSMAAAQSLAMFALDVPQELLNGTRGPVRAINVTGEKLADLDDWYSFVGLENELFNIQLINNVAGRHAPGFPLADLTLELYDSAGVLVDYYSSSAFADDEFEFSLDPFLWDLYLPADDTYFVRIGATGAPKFYPGATSPIPTVGFGTYDLFIFAAALPEPGSVTLLVVGFGMLGLAVRRRRRA